MRDLSQSLDQRLIVRLGQKVAERDVPHPPGQCQGSEAERNGGSRARPTRNWSAIPAVAIADSVSSTSGEAIGQQQHNRCDGRGHSEDIFLAVDEFADESRAVRHPRPQK